MNKHKKKSNVKEKIAIYKLFQLQQKAQVHLH